MNTNELSALCGIGLIAAAVFQFTSAFADEDQPIEVSGEIDGEAITWQIERDTRAPSVVFSTITPGTHQFRINAYRDDRFRREGSLSLDLLISDGEVRSVDLLFFPFSPQHPRFSYGDDHGTGEITLHSLDIHSNSAHLVASFSGELHYHQSPRTQPISHRTRQISLSINVTALRE